MKRRLTIVLAFTLALMLIAGCGSSSTAPAPSGSSAPDPGSSAPPASNEPIFINIATGGTGGVYYPLGGAFAEIWNNNIANMNATVQSTGGSVDNCNKLKGGEVEVALIQNDVSYYAQEGIVLFDDKFPEIRGAFSMYGETVQFAAMEWANINTLEDLRGKRVALGAIGSGSEAGARQILTAAGLDPDKDIDARFLSFNEAAAAMKDRQVDAAVLVVGTPAAALTDLATTNDVKLVPIDGEIAQTLFNSYSYYVPFEIPAGTYRGQTEPVMTVAVEAIVVVREDFDADLLYEMLENVYANHERIVASHAQGVNVTLEKGLDGMSVPLHPGAERFFKDKGIL